MWGALSDGRTGLSFTTAAGPRQCSHSRVRVPLDSRPHFTVSDSRRPFSSPLTTRRATVEVFDPASTTSYIAYQYPRKWLLTSRIHGKAGWSRSDVLVSKNLSPWKHYFIFVSQEMCWFQRIHGSVFVSAFPGNGSTYDNIKLHWCEPLSNAPFLVTGVSYVLCITAWCCFLATVSVQYTVMHWCVTLERWRILKNRSFLNYTALKSRRNYSS
jgi:hypothetical protein